MEETATDHRLSVMKIFIMSKSKEQADIVFYKQETDTDLVSENTGTVWSSKFKEYLLDKDCYHPIFVHNLYIKSQLELLSITCIKYVINVIM